MFYFGSRIPVSVFLKSTVVEGRSYRDSSPKINIWHYIPLSCSKTLCGFFLFRWERKKEQKERKRQERRKKEKRKKEGRERTMEISFVWWQQKQDIHTGWGTTWRRSSKEMVKYILLWGRLYPLKDDQQC